MPYILHTIVGGCSTLVCGVLRIWCPTHTYFLRYSIAHYFSQGCVNIDQSCNIYLYNIKKTSKFLSQVNLNECATSNTDGNNDLPMKPNEAYETLPAPYEEVKFHLETQMSIIMISLLFNFQKTLKRINKTDC